MSSARAPARRDAVGARDGRASFDTPERRAALEARVNEVTATIADEAVRRYYRQDFNARLAQFFAPARDERREQGGKAIGASRAAAETGASAATTSGRAANSRAPGAGRSLMWW